MIKGYSDVRRLPRLGKIRTGIKKQKLDTNGKPVLNKRGEPLYYPVALDYFVCPEEVAKVYGEKPREIDIMFPLSDEEVIFPQYMKKYGASGLRCKGDGVTGYMSVNGNLVARNCNLGDPADEWCKDCQPRADLNVLLPKVPGFGVWTIGTGGWNSIVNVNSQITAIKAMTGGRIDYIPLKLRIVEHKATILNDGKQFQKTVYVLRLDVAERFDIFLDKYGRREQAMLPPHVERALSGFAALSAAPRLPVSVDQGSAEDEPVQEAAQLVEAQEVTGTLATQAQIRKIFALVRGLGMKDTTVKSIIFDMFPGKSSTSQLTKKEASLLIAKMTDNQWAEEWPIEET